MWLGRMASCSNDTSLCLDSEDEESFDAFGEDKDDSDIDLDGLEVEDDDTDLQEPHPGGEEKIDYEKTGWTSQLTDIRIPEFVAASGINVDLKDNPNELDVFLRCLGDDLWDLIVQESNRLAKQKQGDRFGKFRSITREELKAFVGINIIMGITYHLFWSTDDFFGNQGIKRTLSKNRYEDIISNLSFRDSSKEPLRGDENFDRLFKVRAVLDYVRAKCENNFKPTKNISVDEGMIPYRGRLSFKQYMPAKPTRYGIKVWMAADSCNGYVLNFDVYLGKEPNHRRINGLGYDVVTQLTRPFMNNNHCVYFDNFFSSVILFEDLQKNGTYACATVRCNRKDLPRCARDKLRPGEKIVRQKGNLVFTKWHDKRDVCIISTNCSPLEPDVVVTRGNNQEVTKPAVVNLYNKYMGGVDLADQLRQYYPVGRSSKKWYRYIFWFLIDLSICNAFILYNTYRLGHGQAKVKQLTFRTNLARQLIAGYSSTSSLGHSAKRLKIEKLSFSASNANKHFSVRIEGRKKVCVHCKTVGRKTPKGNSVETSFKCLQCSVALCRTCFNDFHKYSD